AVDLVRGIVPVLGVVGDVLPDPVHVRDDLVLVTDRQAPAAEPLVPAGLGVRCAFQVPFLARAGRRTGDARVAAALVGCADGPRAFQPGRDGGDRADVRRDVLAGAPVAPGGRLDQRAVPVDEVDRQPVDLEFT